MASVLDLKGFAISVTSVGSQMEQIIDEITRFAKARSYKVRKRKSNLSESVYLLCRRKAILIEIRISAHARIGPRRQGYINMSISPNEYSVSDALELLQSPDSMWANEMMA